MNIKSILFVCTGNMCRSPFAEALFAKIIRNANIEDIKVSSAGTNTSENNPALPKSIELGFQFDVDLSNHQSRNITHKMIHDNDIIIVMDIHHKREIISMFPLAHLKTKLLSEFSPSEVKGYNIMDPYSHDGNIYLEVFDDINRCVRNLAFELFGIS